MDNLHSLMESYLHYCHMQKRLDEKTRKAYCIDLRQFSENIPTKEVSEIPPEALENYIASLHQHTGSVGKLYWQSAPEVQTQNRKKKDCDFKSIFSLSGIQGYS